MTGEHPRHARDHMTTRRTDSAATIDPGHSPASAEGCALLLHGLSKRYSAAGDEPAAVSNVELSVTPGEFIALLGPSGCGKTTILRMIAGFETPTTGMIQLNGADIIGLAPNRRPIGMVFQSYALFPHLTVRDNVAFGLKLKKMKSADITENVDLTLATMGLTSLADRPPAQLSGGQQQRVALARAMVMRPAIMLFDEPLSNLDAKLRAQMRMEIRDIHHRMGITSVFVTHDQDEAMTMADRIVVMNKGQVEQIGTPDELYHRPSSVFVGDFLGKANFLDAVVLNHCWPRAVVETLGHRRVVPAHPHADRSDSVCLLVRPESLRLWPTRERTDPVGDRATVLSSVFYGSTIEYELESESGNLFASVHDPTPESLFTPGTTVQVSINPDRSWLLPTLPLIRQA